MQLCAATQDAMQVLCGVSHFCLLLLLQVPSADAVLSAGLAAGVNLRKVDSSHVGVSLDETTRLEDVDTLLKVCLGFCACCCFNVSCLPCVRTQRMLSDMRTC
jgi:glycine cleavage system pyridoxal-binding protein P